MQRNNNTNTIGAALKGFSWNVAGNLTRSLAGFAINIILARLLGPEPFGIVAIALLVVGIGNLIIESGLATALIQKEEIDNNDIAFVFTLQMGFSLGITALVFLLAPWLSVQFSTPNAAPVLQIMSLMLVFQAFAQVPSALLRRQLNFKRLQVAQISSFFTGYLAFGLPLAWAGMGVWSLVAAQLIQSGLNAILVYFFAQHSFKLTLKGSGTLAKFGIRVLAANIANWLIQYLDQAIIGRQFGAQNLGYYSRAFFLNSTPIGIVVSSAQISFFSAISRMGKSTETSSFFYNVMSIFALIFFPTYWLIGLESTTIIQLIYGSDWLPAAELLTPLAFAAPFFALVAIEGPLLNGLGKPHYEMWAQWLTAICAFIILTIASRISLIVTAWSLLIVIIIRLLNMSVMTAYALKTSFKNVLLPVLIGLASGTITVLAWTFINHFSQPENFIVASLLRSAVVILVWMLLGWIGRSFLLEKYRSVRHLMYLQSATIQTPLPHEK